MSEICVQLPGIAPMMEPKKCPKFVFKLLKVIALMMEPKECADFVLDLQKVSAPTKQPKNCPKFVQLAEGHCSDKAAEKMSENCVQLPGHCSNNAVEKMSGFRT